jgi:hypothetical protein
LLVAVVIDEALMHAVDGFDALGVSLRWTNTDYVGFGLESFAVLYA